MLLGAAVGLVVGGLTTGALTLYVYAIGALIGAPMGAVAGGILGFRTPLRDTVLLAFSCGAGWLTGAALIGPLKPLTENEPLVRGLAGLLFPGLGMALGIVMLFLPLRLAVPLRQRRTVASVMAVLTGAWMIWRLCAYAYGWGA